jgi:hypothetical protein
LLPTKPSLAPNNGYYVEAISNNYDFSRICHGLSGKNFKGAQRGKKSGETSNIS